MYQINTFRANIQYFFKPFDVHTMIKDLSNIKNGHIIKINSYTIHTGVIIGFANTIVYPVTITAQVFLPLVDKTYSVDLLETKKGFSLYTMPHSLIRVDGELTDKTIHVKLQQVRYENSQFLILAVRDLHDDHRRPAV